jgi:transposase-like protein
MSGGRGSVPERNHPRKAEYAATREDAERHTRAFQAWATKKGAAAAGRRLDDDWDRLVTFYQFPKEHWKHLRTTNVVGSPFPAVRLRTAAAKRFNKVENATAIRRCLSPRRAKSTAELLTILSQSLDSASDCRLWGSGTSVPYAGAHWDQ